MIFAISTIKKKILQCETDIFYDNTSLPNNKINILWEGNTITKKGQRDKATVS